MAGNKNTYTEFIKPDTETAIENLQGPSRMRIEEKDQNRQRITLVIHRGLSKGWKMSIEVRIRANRADDVTKSLRNV